MTEPTDCFEGNFPSPAEHLKVKRRKYEHTAQTESPSYKVAYDDVDFILRDDMLPTRVMLELSKADAIMHDHNIQFSVVIFGSARIPPAEDADELLQLAEKQLKSCPNSATAKQNLKTAKRQQQQAYWYEQARKMASCITETSLNPEIPTLHVMTGGGPGIMEAANRGADEAGGKTIGLNIVLPREQTPNPYITPELCFQFHYFAVRKMHFLMRARALIVFPGGFGTLDELFETLTLIQTKKIKPLPVLLFGKDYWQKLINWDWLIDQGMVDDADLQNFQYVDSVEEALDIITASLPPA